MSNELIRLDLPTFDAPETQFPVLISGQSSLLEGALYELRAANLHLRCYLSGAGSTEPAPALTD